MSKIEAIQKYVDIIKVLAPERFHIKYGGLNAKLLKQNEESHDSNLLNFTKKDDSLDKNVLERYMNDNIQDFSGKIVSIRKFHHNTLNMHFYIQSNDQKEYVLKLNQNKSDIPIEREYRIMKKLRKTNIPVPKVYCLCLDKSIIGSHFFIMEFIRGRVFKDPLLPKLNSIERFTIYNQMNELLVAIHQLDFKQLGLEDFGKITGSYCERQIEKWKTHYQQNSTEKIQELDYLISWLEKKVKEIDNEFAIIHGDFKIDNLIFHPNEPKIIGVIGWEHSTIGHPLVDLSNSCLSYNTISNFSSISSIYNEHLEEFGIPCENEFIQAYCKKMRRSIKNWTFFIAFSFFRGSSFLLELATKLKKKEIIHRFTEQQLKMMAMLSAGYGWKKVNSPNEFIPNTLTNKLLRREFIFERVPIKISNEFKKLNFDLWDFMVKDVLPLEILDSEDETSTLKYLQKLSKEKTFWNLFHRSDLSNCEFSLITEIMGRTVFDTKILFNNSFPNTPVIELLNLYGSSDQKKEYLDKLLNGEISSSFVIDDSIQIKKKGHSYFINGSIQIPFHNEIPKLLLLCGITDDNVPIYRKHSIFLISMNSHIEITELKDFGMKLTFKNFKSDYYSLIGSEGQGYMLYKGKIRPFLVHFFMRYVGLAEKGLEIICKNVKINYSKYSKSLILNEIALIRIEIDYVRNMILQVCFLLDKFLIDSNKILDQNLAIIEYSISKLMKKVIENGLVVSVSSKEDISILNKMNLISNILLIQKFNTIDTISNAELLKSHL